MPDREGRIAWREIYALHPLYPGKNAGNINIDTVNPWGKADIEDYNNNSTLDDLLAAAASTDER
jgi:hypothetical protein